MSACSPKMVTSVPVFNTPLTEGSLSVCPLLVHELFGCDFSLFNHLMLNLQVQVTLFSYCYFFMMYSFHIASLFSSTLLMLYSSMSYIFPVAFFLWLHSFMLHIIVFCVYVLPFFVVLSSCYIFQNYSQIMFCLRNKVNKRII